MKDFYYFLTEEAWIKRTYSLQVFSIARLITWSGVPPVPSAGRYAVSRFNGSRGPGSQSIHLLIVFLHKT